MKARLSTSDSLKQGCKRSAAHTQSNQSQHSRVNTRCGGESLKRKCYRLSRNSASASFHLVLLVKASSREKSTKTPRLMLLTFAIFCLALRRRLEKRIRLWLICLQG